MGGIRVRWRGLGRLVGLAAVAVAAPSLLPGMLAAPQAPPLAPDVGLPRVMSREAPPVHAREARPGPKARPKLKLKPRPSRGVTPASAVIGTTPRADRPAPRPVPPPSPTPEPVGPASAPEPSPPAPPPQPAPEDGSMEFAPH